MSTRLADGVWVLDLGLFPPLKSNAYLVDESATDTGGRRSPSDSDEAPCVTVVDTGLPLNVPRLVTELEHTGDGYAPADVDRVLLTHYDLDHTGGLRRLQSAGFDGEVYVGRADVDLASGAWDPQWFHPKGVFHRAVRPFFGLPDDVRPVEEGDAIGGFTAYHTPGHNPGHTVYVHEVVDAAFLGDLVWEESGDLTPPFWLDSYDMYELRESIRAFARRTPEFELACPGHGTPLAGGYEALQRLAARL